MFSLRGEGGRAKERDGRQANDAPSGDAHEKRDDPQAVALLAGTYARRVRTFQTRESTLQARESTVQTRESTVQVREFAGRVFRTP
ncbi:hypothetical protein [Amycolatopsis sp. NPDC051102]|uniref:hypothetical protein n=1 Tax=Amycolatopsis sp. NPDC051102 TaxID=3155163 RepID=UPI00343D0B9E